MHMHLEGIIDWIGYFFLWRFLDIISDLPLNTCLLIRCYLIFSCILRSLGIFLRSAVSFASIYLFGRLGHHYGLLGSVHCGEHPNCKQRMLQEVRGYSQLNFQKVYLINVLNDTQISELFGHRIIYYLPLL
jgi:hypothetical protein